MKKFLLLLVFTAAVGRTQTPSVNDYQISGVVVDHLTNHPLNHVLVQITRTGKGGGDASALTEADGRFLFVHVPEGKYQLTAEKRGQTPEAFHSDAGYSTAIVVDGLRKTTSIVFAMRTDASINGTVTADDGEQVRDAQIDLFRETVVDGEAQTIQMRGGRTNSSGHFHIGHLDAGNYYLSVQGRPWYSASAFGSDNVAYPVTFYGDTTDADSARLIALTEGASVSLPINLHAVPGIRVNLAQKTRGVSVFVQGPGGSRIPVPAVLSGPPTGPHGVRPAGGGIFYTPAMPVQDNSQLELMNLAAGRYEVMRYGEDGGLSGGSHVVDLVNGSTLDFEEAGTGAISGTLIFDGKHPPGTIAVILGNGQRGGEMAEVAGDGTFKFQRGVAGSYRVHLNNQGLTVASITVAGAKYIRDSLDVTAGANVQLTIRTVASENLATLQGFVTSDDKSTAGAMVLLLPQDADRTRLIRRDQSDSDGSFSLANVLPGRYTLIAIDDGHDLAYKTESVIKPYLASGVPITIPRSTSEAVNVPLQTRRH